MRDFMRRWFHPLAALSLLIVAAIGFQAFYLRGNAMNDRMIAPPMMPYVIVHASALTGWLLLSIIQPLLISVRRRAVHRVVGWCGAVLALLIATSGATIALRSAAMIADVPFAGMPYRGYLLTMLAQIAAFAGFVTAGILTRRQAWRHRAMMLLATLAVIPGATIRTPALYAWFGSGGLPGIFGPVFVLGGVLVLTLAWVDRRFDRWLTGGYLAMLAFFTLATAFATSAAWLDFTRTVLGI